MEEEKVVVEEVQAEETAEQPVMVEAAPEEGAQIITIKKIARSWISIWSSNKKMESKNGSLHLCTKKWNLHY